MAWPEGRPPESSERTGAREAQWSGSRNLSGRIQHHHVQFCFFSSAVKVQGDRHDQPGRGQGGDLNWQSVQGGSCAEIWCSESRWLLSLREGDGLGSRSRRALCPTCSQNNSGPEAETSTLQCSLFYVRSLGFLVFLRWGLISLNVLYQWITVCARNVFFEGSVLVWFSPRISLGLAFAQRTRGRVSRMSLWLRAAEGDVSYTGVLSCATCENNALSREWPF